MARAVVIGGGWAGVGAPVALAKAGVEEVHLFEKTDLLLGTGLVGGIMRNNGRWTATEEMFALGVGDPFAATDACARHANMEFPGHKHASLYDVTKIEPYVRRMLLGYGVRLHMKSRVTGVEWHEVNAPKPVQSGFWGRTSRRGETAPANKEIRSITYYVKEGARFEGPHVLEADVFVETTGSCGPQSECARFGSGCVMCVIRCPTYGGRVSIAGLCGIEEMVGGTGSGKLGSFSGSCKLVKESLPEWIVKDLDEKGVCVVPLPPELIDDDKLDKKACQQYASKAFSENIILLDTGHAKLMTSHFPLEKLQLVPGFENARYDDPYSGGMGNSVRYLALSPRDNFLKTDGMENLFCGGEKAGPLVGHTEAIVTGALAGHNAARHAYGLPLLELPTELAVGDAIAHVNDQIHNVPGGLFQKYTFSGSVYFQRMVQLGLYETDKEVIAAKVERLGLTNIMGTPLRAAEPVLSAV